MAIGLITHMDTTRKEDVVDIITNVAFRSTPFTSNRSEGGVAQNTLHEWLIDTFADPADNAAVESSDATDVDLSPPTRTTNVVQMFRKVVKVSDTQRAVSHYGHSDPYTYQLQKKMVELARDMEKANIAGTRASGASGTARRQDGAIQMISTNATARASGTSLSEDEYNDIMSGVYDSGSDDYPDEVYVRSYLKKVISGYTEGVQKNIDVEKYKQVRRVSIYEGDFGEQAIFTSREVPVGAVLAVDGARWRQSYLQGRRPTHVPLSKTGSSTKGMIEGESTLEALNEASSAYRSGYFTG